MNENDCDSGVDWSTSSCTSSCPVRGSVIFNNCSDGDVRLVGPTEDSLEGRVEICINGVWGTICFSNHRYRYRYWDERDARVVCRQLGLQEFGE